MANTTTTPPSPSPSPSQPIPPLYDLIVIGGGVVGLACLRAATLAGWNCALVEAETDLLSHASGSNSGIACTGVDARPGSLERALIRDSVSQIRIYCRNHNIPARPCGSLVCLWPWDDGTSDGDGGDADIDRGTTATSLLLNRVLEESHEAGDTDATLLTGAQVTEDYESNLESTCRGAVHIPGEIVLDPWLYSISLAAHAVENGAEIYTDFRVDLESLALHDGIWWVRRHRRRSHRGVGASSSSSSSSTEGDDDCGVAHGSDVHELRARAIVNAAGIWADVVESSSHGTCRWTAKPRRGQYRVYRADAQTRITHPIQPISSQRTKGIFVFSTMYGQLVVGPTALDQVSRTDRTIDPTVADELDRTIQRILPRMDPKDALVGEYVGVRPGTDRRDYQIHLTPHRRWIAVAGIRSTGLTASLGIGDHVRRLLQCVLPAPPTDERTIRTTPMPSIDELVAGYQAEKNSGNCNSRDHRQGGYVRIHGRRYRVTHPLTRFGLESMAAAVAKTPSQACSDT
jgi:glycerol-3-phosphate dehydrogenase